MRLVLIHGRAQGERDEAQIRAQWLTALDAGCKKAGLDPLSPDADVRVPFYGRLLDGLTARPAPPPGEVVSRGPGGEPDRFEATLLMEIAERAGVTDAEAASDLPSGVERRIENWEWMRAKARWLSKRAPWLSEKIMRRFTADVDAYMNRPKVTRQVNELVAAEFGGGPTVVVGHSLGSIVAYWTLSKHTYPLRVPLFVTVGSPLGIPTIKAGLPHPLGKPLQVAQWFNAADVRDPVALFPQLDRDNFPAEIENLADVHNPHDNPHGIAGYLSDTVVARKIVEALRPGPVGSVNAVDLQRSKRRKRRP
jgi:Alpha/beta hydrolase